MKPLPYEAILSFEEAIIREFFPRGVVQVGKGDRWQPAEKKADRTLARVLKDKKARIEKPRFLHANAARPPTDNVEMALGYRTASTRDKRTGRRVEPEPQMTVTKEDEARFARDNRDRFREQRSEEFARREVRSVLAGLRQIGIEAAKGGRDPVAAIASAAAALMHEERDAA